MGIPKSPEALGEFCRGEARSSRGEAKLQPLVDLVNDARQLSDGVNHEVSSTIVQDLPRFGNLDLKLLLVHFVHVFLSECDIVTLKKHFSFIFEFL